MRAEYDRRSSPREPAQKTLDPAHRHRVDAVEGFIEEEDPRGVHEAQREGQFLARALGCLRCQCLLKALELEELDQLVQPAGRFPFRPAPPAEQ